MPSSHQTKILPNVYYIILFNLNYTHDRNTISIMVVVNTIIGPFNSTHEKDKLCYMNAFGTPGEMKLLRLCVLLCMVMYLIGELYYT